MKSQIRNIIIFVGIGLVFVFIYFTFIKGNGGEVPVLVGTGAPVATTSKTNTTPQKEAEIAKDFLTLLLNVKNITLNDAIFSDVAFTSLRDSSILLIPDGNEGRPNPFAPIGTDVETIQPPAIQAIQTQSGASQIVEEFDFGSNIDFDISGIDGADQRLAN